MPRYNVQRIQFDPSTLKEVGSSESPYGVSSGDNPEAQQRIRSTMLVGPDGSRYVRRTLIDPATGRVDDMGYVRQAPDGSRKVLKQEADGTWNEGDWKGSSLAQTVLGDEKLMMFLAVAGGTALYAASAAGTAGAATTAAAPAAAEGGIIASAAPVAAPAAAAGTAAGTAGSGAVTAGAIEGAAGVAELGMVATPATAGAAVAGGVPASTLAAGGVTSGSTWWSTFLNSQWGKAATSELGMQLIGSAVSGVGQAILDERKRDQAIEDRDNERAYRTRNLTASQMPKIDWGVVQVQRREIPPPPNPYAADAPPSALNTPRLPPGPIQTPIIEGARSIYDRNGPL